MNKHALAFISNTRVLFLLSIFYFPISGSLSYGENKQERLEWLKNAGLGLFIHWSIDSQIGTVISHSLVGASKDYRDRYFNELPNTFNPTKFNAEEWARLAKVCGFKYVVFTTKHHSGFCMFDSKTNDFNIMHTPFGRDITREIVEAFRKQGLAIGFYFSPDDFYVLHSQGNLISRRRPDALPINNRELTTNNRAQVEELLTKYGQIDVFFIDGATDDHEGDLRKWIWSLQPDCLITRGAIKTPEIAPSTKYSLPDESSDTPWEACFTMGTSWQFKPTNENYNSGKQLIESLIETRSKGGTMLLNIGPEPNGEIPQEQENILREIGTWMMVNREAIYDVRPWKVFREGDIWFTRKKNSDTVYAFFTNISWPWGTEMTFSLNSVRTTDKSLISVLGQNDRVLEYRPEITPKTRWKQTDEKLIITAVRAQRIYNDRTWLNPIVLKITHANPTR